MKKLSIGLLLVLLGSALFLITSLPVTIAMEAINTSFTIFPGGRYGPYDAGTVHHTRLLGKSVLEAVVVVEGESLRVSVEGSNTKNLKNIAVEAQHSLIIDPADDQYTFTFDNTVGKAAATVRFTLREVWTGPLWATSPPLLITGFGGLILLPLGLIAIVVSHLRTQRLEPPS